MTLVGVDARRYSAAGLSATIRRAATGKQPIVLLVDNRRTFATIVVGYSGGIQLPLLMRASGKRDLIADIVRSRSTVRSP